MALTTVERIRPERSTEFEIRAFLGVDEAAQPSMPGNLLTMRRVPEGVKERQRMAPATVVEPPRASSPAARRKTLQGWVGVVSDLRGDEFIAVLQDQTDFGRGQERVRLDVADVDPQDRVLLTPGAIFYWYIFEEIRLGTRRTVSDLRFQRVAPWSSKDLTEIRQRAERRASQFGVKPSPASPHE